jgi:hypothetical protein
MPRESQGDSGGVGLVKTKLFSSVLIEYGNHTMFCQELNGLVFQMRAAEGT